MVNVAELILLITGKDETSKALQSVGKGSDDLANKIAGIGKAATGALGIIAGGGLIAGVYKLGESFDQAFDKIRIGTGATGKQLDGLEGSFKKVFTSVPTSMGAASTAIADLNIKLGLSGPELEAVSKQALNLSRITGSDLATNIDSVSKLVNNWGLNSGEAAVVMDKLFVASQNTGVGVDALAQGVTKFGPALREMGFTLDQSIALLGGLEKSGVDGELALRGLRTAMVTFAQEGKDAKAGLDEVIASIKGAGSGAEATAIAVETFGRKAGPDLANAIRTGKFDVDALTQSVAGAGGAIAQTAQDTDDFGEKFTLFKNKVLTAIEPLASGLFDLTGKFFELGSGAGPVEMLGVAAVVATPFLFSLGEKAFRAVEGLLGLGTAAETAGLSLKTKLTLGVSAAALAIGGLDALLLKFTGKGIVNTLVDFFDHSRSQAERAAGAVERFRKEVEFISDKSAQNTKFLADLRTNVDELTAAFNRHGLKVEEVTSRIWTDWGLGFSEGMKATMDIIPVLDEVSGNIRGLGQTLRENNVPARELVEIWVGLPPVLKDAFAAGANIAGALIAIGQTAPSVLGAIAQAEANLAQTTDDSVLQQQSALQRLADAQDQSARSTIQSIQSVLPAMDETATRWAQRIQKFVDDTAAMESNLADLYGQMKAAGIEAPEAITQALAEKGPEYVAKFRQLFYEDPVTALQLLKIAFPDLSGQAINEMVKRIVSDANKPKDATKQMVDDAVAAGKTAAAGASDIGQAVATGVAFGIDGNTLAAVQAAQRMANAVKGILTGIGGFNIGSPSKWAEDDVGQPIAAGIGVGMEQGLAAELPAWTDMLAGFTATLATVANAAGQQIAAAMKAGFAGAGGLAQILSPSAAVGGGQAPLSSLPQGIDPNRYYANPYDVPGATHDSLPGVNGYDWEWVPGKGWHLVPIPNFQAQYGSSMAQGQIGPGDKGKPGDYVGVGGWNVTEDPKGRIFTPQSPDQPQNVHWIQDPNGNWSLVADVPEHESGLWRVPYTGYLASLHRGEAVLPAREAEQYRAAAAAGGGSPVTITFNNVSIHALDPDSARSIAGDFAFAFESELRTRGIV
jgi:TP901 family phage tail tape measure protein